MSTGKAQVSVTPWSRILRERLADHRLEAERERRRIARAREAAAHAAQLEQEAELAAQRTVDDVLARHRALTDELRRSARLAGEEAPTAALGAPDRGHGEPVPAEWLGLAERTLDELAAGLARLRTTAFTVAVDRVAASERAAATSDVDATIAAPAPVTPATPPTSPTAPWADDVVEAARRNLDRVRAGTDAEAVSESTGLAERIAEAVRAGERSEAEDLLDRLRLLVDRVGRRQERAERDAARARDLRAHLVELDGEGSPTGAAWIAQLDRVTLGLEPLEPELEQRIGDHIIAEGLAVALTSLGYAHDGGFAVDLARDGRATAWRDDPDHDGHAVRFALLPGSVVDFTFARDGMHDHDPSLDRRLEQQWCDEDLPRLLSAMEAQGLGMTVDDRSPAGARPVEAVDGLRTRDDESTARRRRERRRDADGPRANEVGP